MEDFFTIPTAIQLRVDDVGWHNGDDDRYFSRPSRTGIPRKHVPEDYRMLHELGKALNMRILCSLVVSEWDKDNLLRGVPHVTWDPEGWDRASQIDTAYCEACREILDGSEYLNYTLHGLLHGYYDSGELVTEEQYYPRVYDAARGGWTKAWRRLSDDEFRRHLDLFFAICRSWDFQKPVVCFASPNGNRGTPESNAGYAEILKEYGICSWHNGWRNFAGPAAVVRGIVCCKGWEIMPWNVFDADPDLLPVSENPRTDLCCHWPNFLHFNPEHSLERIPAWVRWFDRQSEVWGCMLSRDCAFGDSQAVYRQYAQVSPTADGAVCIDLSAVDGTGALLLKNEFYVSTRNGHDPRILSGGTLTLWETKRDFRTWKIVRSGAPRVVLAF